MQVPIAVLAQKRTNLMRRAHKTGIEFDLNLADMPDIPGRCPVCKCWLTLDPDKPSTVTVDKFLPHLGYVRGNIDWMCARCNVVKANGSQAEHKLIYEYMGKRGHVRESVRQGSQGRTCLRARVRHLYFQAAGTVSLWRWAFAPRSLQATSGRHRKGRVLHRLP